MICREGPTYSSSLWITCIHHLPLNHEHEGFLWSSCYTAAVCSITTSSDRHEGAVSNGTSRWRTRTGSLSSCWCFGKPVRVGPLCFSLICGRAYTRPDVPREFYPRRSATSTHFPHLPDMRHFAGERGQRNPRVAPLWISTRFRASGRAGLVPGQLCVTTQRQEQTTIDYKTVCCSSAARWRSRCGIFFFFFCFFSNPTKPR